MGDIEIVLSGMRKMTSAKGAVPKWVEGKGTEQVQKKELAPKSLEENMYTIKLRRRHVRKQAQKGMYINEKAQKKACS